MPVTLPAISSALLDSVTDDEIAVFAFCVVEKPMLRTTKAKAAATITNAIITIADSIPMTPLRVFLLLVEFITSDIHYVVLSLCMQKLNKQRLTNEITFSK